MFLQRVRTWLLIDPLWSEQVPKKSVFPSAGHVSEDFGSCSDLLICSWLLLLKEPVYAGAWWY